VIYQHPLAYLLGLEGVALPAATNAAWRGEPAAIIWHFQLSAP
jgi:hypothetical protein